jgi:uncharacterized protein (DUF2267 family)
MATEALGVVDSAVEDLYRWIHEILEETGWDDRHYALQALRGSLHALRNRLLIDQTAKLSAQLPLLIRGFFFENWDPSRAPITDRHVDEFIDHVRPYFTGYGRSFDVGDSVRAVYRVLARHVSAGEVNKIRRALPQELRALWPAEGAGTMETVRGESAEGYVERTESSAERRPTM